MACLVHASASLARCGIVDTFGCAACKATSSPAVKSNRVPTSCSSERSKGEAVRSCDKNLSQRTVAIENSARIWHQISCSVHHKVFSQLCRSNSFAHSPQLLCRTGNCGNVSLLRRRRVEALVGLRSWQKEGELSSMEHSTIRVAGQELGIVEQYTHVGSMCTQSRPKRTVVQYANSWVSLTSPKSFHSACVLSFCSFSTRDDSYETMSNSTPPDAQRITRIASLPQVSTTVKHHDARTPSQGPSATFLTRSVCTTSLHISAGILEPFVPASAGNLHHTSRPGQVRDPPRHKSPPACDCKCAWPKASPHVKRAALKESKSTQ